MNGAGLIASWAVHLRRLQLEVLVMTNIDRRIFVLGTGSAALRLGVSNNQRTEFSQKGPPKVPELGSVTTRDRFKGLRGNRFTNRSASASPGLTRDSREPRKNASTQSTQRGKLQQLRHCSSASAFNCRSIDRWISRKSALSFAILYPAKFPQAHGYVFSTLLKKQRDERSSISRPHGCGLGTRECESFDPRSDPDVLHRSFRVAAMNGYCTPNNCSDRFENVLKPRI